jgi:hypothetical protein
VRAKPALAKASKVNKRTSKSKTVLAKAKAKGVKTTVRKKSVVALET